jgi:ELWxxDGT repeat protein
VTIHDASVVKSLHHKSSKDAIRAKIMWTDQQLLEQGWTPAQIQQYRIEQAVEETPKEVGLTQTVPNGEQNVDLSQSTASIGGFTSLFADKTQAVLVVCMLVLFPLSMYSTLFAEGPQGPQGDAGEQGANGTAGSSFALVLSAADLPPCDASIQNQIFFIANEAGFNVCQNNTWGSISLTGPQGTPGQDGTDGAAGQDGVNGTDGQDGADGAAGQDGTNGQNGADGAAGQDGTDGENGLTSLIVSSAEPSGSNCANGGTRVETGIDDDRNGFLGPAEVDAVVFVCNGQTGADGADGANGSSTTTMMVASLSVAPSYLGCNGTGQLLKQGLDDGSGNGIAQNGVLESGEVLMTSLICTTFAVDQVQDVNAGTSGSNPAEFVTLNSTLYFITTSPSGVWSLDANDTLTSIYSGFASSLRSVGSLLMFTGSDVTNGIEPWVYDPSTGTAGIVSDINPGTSGSFAGGYTLLGTTAYFAARDGAGNFDLWAYEHANTSTWKVDDGVNPQELVAVGPHLYYSTPTELRMWNTTSTTAYDIEIMPGALGSSPSDLVVQGTRIYLAANDGSGGGIELQAYETTNNSTWQVADPRPGSATSFPSDFAFIGTRIYMHATDGTDFELWAYDSANHSVWEVADINPGSGHSRPADLTVHQDTVYFSADDGTTGKELWAHNAVNGTTWQVIDLHPSGGNIGDIHLHEGNVYFAGDDGVDGSEVWRLIFSRTVTFV